MWNKTHLNPFFPGFRRITRSGLTDSERRGAWCPVWTTLKIKKGSEWERSASRWSGDLLWNFIRSVRAEELVLDLQRRWKWKVSPQRIPNASASRLHEYSCFLPRNEPILTTLMSVSCCVITSRSEAYVWAAALNPIVWARCDGANWHVNFRAAAGSCRHFLSACERLRPQ